MPSPTVTAVASISPSAAPCITSLGLAYEPDGGNGGSLHGVQFVHFEDNNQNLCGTNAGSAPAVVSFASSVGALAFSPGATEAIALLANGSGGYSLAQDVFGATVGALTPAGTPYDLSVQPSPAPSASPVNAPLIPDGTSATIIGGDAGFSGVALVAGPGAAPNALVGLTSLDNAPPQYGQSVPFDGTTYKIAPTSGPRSIVKLSGFLSNSTATVLARGPASLLSFALTLVSTGYQLNAVAEDTNLGSKATLRGAGALAFSPADPTRAVVGGTSAGPSNRLTLVTGLPNAITEASTVDLPGATVIRSVAISTNGSYAAAATDAGIYIASGVNSQLTLVTTPFGGAAAAAGANALPYTNCNGAAATLANVYGVGFSFGSVPGTGGQYLVALGSSNPAPTGCRYPASVVAVPFDTTNGGTPSPAPSIAPSPGTSPTANPARFVQNNVVAPPANADYFIVR